MSARLKQFVILFVVITLFSCSREAEVRKEYEILLASIDSVEIGMDVSTAGRIMGRKCTVVSYSELNGSRVVVLSYRYDIDPASSSESFYLKFDGCMTGVIEKGIPEFYY